MVGLKSQFTQILCRLLNGNFNVPVVVLDNKPTLGCAGIATMVQMETTQPTWNDGGEKVE